MKTSTPGKKIELNLNIYLLFSWPMSIIFRNVADFSGHTLYPHARYQLIHKI